jgi:hypothetical protein
MVASLFGRFIPGKEITVCFAGDRLAPTVGLNAVAKNNFADIDRNRTPVV